MNEDELEFRKQLELQVAFPHEDVDIDKEERKIANLRDNKLKTPSGLWQLLVYYDTLTQYACSWRPPNADAVLARWHQRHPQSPSPILIASALAECQFKLDLRMVGINMLPRLGDAPIDVRLDNALRQWKDLLVTHRDIARKDPQYYLSLVRIMSYQREPLDKILRTLDEATDLQPNYHQIYFDILRLNRATISPQQVEAVANYAVSKTQQADGNSMYARVWWFAFQALYGPAAFDLPPFDWEKMKAGMKDVLARHPDAWNTNTFALFACLRQDQLLAQDLLRRIGDQPYVPAWGSFEMHKSCSEWASDTTQH